MRVAVLGAGSWGTTVASLLVATFGLAVACTLGAIVAFTVEMMMAGSGVRAIAAAGRRSGGGQPSGS